MFGASPQPLQLDSQEDDLRAPTCARHMCTRVCVCENGSVRARVGEEAGLVGG